MYPINQHRIDIVNPRRSVTALDIVKICWLAPVIFSFHLGAQRSMIDLLFCVAYLPSFV